MEKHLPNLLTGFWVITLCVALLALSRLVRPGNDQAALRSTFDGGEHPVGKPWAKPVAHYHLIMISAVLFSLSLFLLYPMVINFKAWVESGHGLEVFTKVSCFIFILALGLAYVWKKGDLDWKVTLSDQDSGGHGDT